MESKKVTINVPVISKSKIKSVGLVFLTVAAVIMFINWFSSDSYIKSLKNANKENLTKIDSIQNTKQPIQDSLELLKQKIKEKDEAIFFIEQIESDLKSKLKYFRNENNRIKNSYFNNDIDQRIMLWSRLTREKDTSTRTDKDKLQR